MNLNDHIISASASLLEALDALNRLSGGAMTLFAVDCQGRLTGTVTDGDIRRTMERRRAEFFNIRARDIATLHPKTIAADEKLIEAEKMMTRNKITSLLVTDDDGRLQGVVQIYDIKL